MTDLQQKKRDIIAVLKLKDDDPVIIGRVHDAMFSKEGQETWNDDFDAKYKITAKKKTWIKAKPVDSSKLSDDQKKECKAGTDLEVNELEICNNTDLKFKVPGKAAYEYAFKPHWDIPDGIKGTLKEKKHEAIAGVFKTKVTDLKISQPDGSTCQSACVAMATESQDVYGIRSQLTARGVAGDPTVMSWYLNRELGDRHTFDDNASLSEMREWLRDGEFLISYGWFTSSGHVIAFDGVSIDKGTLAYKFDVSDPWSEFDFSSWSYNNPSVQFFDGYYSALGIYAACVAGQSVGHAQQIYAADTYDSNKKGAWVHRISPIKK